MAWIALARWKERLVALASALAFGGILASWSWGGGIMIWPVDPESAPSFLSRSDARMARFVSAVRTAPNRSSEDRTATVSASDGPDGPILASRVLLPRGEKREVTLDLSRFAGRTVKLSLGAEETPIPGAPLIWQAPRIELSLEGAK